MDDATTSAPPAAGADPGWEGLAADGGIVRIRPASVGDEDALHELCLVSSDRTLFLRFFSINRRAADRYLTSMARPSDDDHVALVAEAGGQVVAIAGWERVTDDTAEVALLVEDAHQLRGIGTLLLEELARRARFHGIARLVADVLPENQRMLGVFTASGLHAVNDVKAGVVHSLMSTELDVEALARMDEREGLAEVASLEPLFAPRHVAVIGASRTPGGVGREVLRNIMSGGFTGGVHVVNPNALEVAGLPSYARVSDVRAAVDLAVIAVPVPQLLEVVADCGVAGVRAAVVLTSGLGEAGDEGIRLQRQLLDLARRHSLRLVGPNCIGLLNTDPAVSLYAWFGATPVRAGRLAVATQSGAVGIAIADHAWRSGTGLAALISLGNKVDVSGNDLLLRWWQDQRVGVIALYLESLGNPRKFARLARRIGVRIPVLVVKGGRSTSGQRAGMSHTAAASSPDTAVDALFAQSGVLRMDTVEELVDVSRLVEGQPVPAGGRLAVVGNGGGVGVLAADAAQAHQLAVPSLSPALRESLGQPATDNPIDLGAVATPDRLRRVLELVAASGEVDALLVTVAVTRTNDAATMLAALTAADLDGLPLIVTLLGAGEHALTSVPLAGGREAPVYPFPETAVRALAHVVQYGRWRRTPPGAVPSYSDVPREAVRRRVAATLGGGTAAVWADLETATDLLTAYHIPVVPTRRAATVADACSAAEQLGFPVVLKTDVPHIVHKTEVNGVRTGLTDQAMVAQAFDAIVGGLGGGVLVQPTVSGVIELVAGVTREAGFGPLVMVGLGGVLTDVLGDRTFRPSPLTDRDVREMLLGLRAAPLFSGYRGAPPVDLTVIEDLLLRLSALADDIADVVQLDLNPIIVDQGSATVVDAKIQLAPAVPQPDSLARSLRR
jgi:acyl-CoA synthetase (NDP forming)/GNAT superfamily N-acetyltransferase